MNPLSMNEWLPSNGSLEVGWVLVLRVVLNMAFQYLFLAYLLDKQAQVWYLGYVLHENFNLSHCRT